MTGPRVSVCIPTYNQVRFLQETLDSVICQSYTDFEVLVMDDCSVDRTGEIAREYAARDSRIRFLANPANLGMVPNWNRCMEMARGRYIKFLFGDDLLTSTDTLGRMVEILDKECDVSLVASARIVINEKSRVLETVAGFPDGVRIPGKELIKLCLDNFFYQHNRIGEPSTVMFRKAAAGRGFDPRYRQLVDLEMWFHLLEHGAFAYVGEPLCAFRTHTEQQTVKNRENLSYIDDMFYLLDDYLGRTYIGVGQFAKRYALFRLAYFYWKKLGDRKVALQKIGAHIPPGIFFLQLALYRLAAPFINLRHSMAKRRRTCEAGRSEGNGFRWI
jgi:glycosyltransferase involved in cell wall biosynthesis